MSQVKFQNSIIFVFAANAGNFVEMLSYGTRFLDFQYKTQ